MVYKTIMMNSVNPIRIELYQRIAKVSDPYPLELIGMICEYVPVTSAIADGVEVSLCKNEQLKYDPYGYYVYDDVSGIMCVDVWKTKVLTLRYELGGLQRIRTVLFDDTHRMASDFIHIIYEPKNIIPFDDTTSGFKSFTERKTRNGMIVYASCDGDDTVVLTLGFDQQRFDIEHGLQAKNGVPVFNWTVDELKHPTLHIGNTSIEIST